LRIEVSRYFDSGTPIDSELEIAASDGCKKKMYFLPEKWLKRFLPLMEEVERSGYIGDGGCIMGAHYIGYLLYAPKKGNEKEVEKIYCRFKRKLFWKKVIRTAILLGFLWLSKTLFLLSF